MTAADLGRLQAVRDAARPMRDAVEGFLFDLAYAVAFPVAAWWVHHGLRRPDLAGEIRDWSAEATGPPPPLDGRNGMEERCYRDGCPGWVSGASDYCSERCEELEECVGCEGLSHHDQCPMWVLPL